MSSNDLEWLKLRFSWLTSERVQLMPSLAELALLRLILRCGKAGSIPANVEECLLLIGKADMSREAVEIALREFEPHPTAGGRLIHVRTLRDRADTVEKVERIRELRRKSGKKGGEANGKQTGSKTEANASGLLEQTGSKTEANASGLLEQTGSKTEANAEAKPKHLLDSGEEWSGVEWSGVDVLPKESSTSSNTPETPPPGGASSATDSAPLALVSEPAPTAKPEIDACPHREIARIWNEVAGAHGMPKVMDMTPARETTLRGLWAWFVGSKAEKLDSVRALFERTASSDFLRNGPGRFDWVIAPANRVKILEGNYDNRAGRANGGRR